MSNLDKLLPLLPAFKQLIMLLKFSRGKKSEYLSNLTDDQINQFLNAKFLVYKQKIEDTKDFLSNVARVKRQLEEELLLRDQDPNREPTFDSTLFANTRFKLAVPSDPNKVVSPFRLSFRPPKSYDGIFLLSPNGLYYDSQSGGLDPVNLYLSGLDIPKIGDFYKFSHAPNLGGRGETVSLKDLNTFNNTLFDLNIIDDSVEMKEWYDADHFLQTLVGNKNKKINDLSGVIIQNEADETGDAVLISLRHQISFESGHFNDLIKRRKKQIEVAVKAPGLYGVQRPRPDIPGEDTIFFDLDTPAAGGHYGGPGDTTGPGPEGDPGDPAGPFGNTFVVGAGVERQQVTMEGLPLFKPGQVPVNDFSYLASLNFTIDTNKQKKLLFDNAEIEGIVKPLSAKYTQPFGEGAEYSFSQYLIPPIGKGGIFYDLSSTECELVSLNDNIESDNLIAIYNYLDGKVSSPDALATYDLSNVLNCAATRERENAAQMIGINASSVFADGLGVPYLVGMTRNNAYIPAHVLGTGGSFGSPGGALGTSPGVNSTVSGVSAVGSVLKLPNTKEFRDLGYGPSGFTFETWVRVPNLGASAAGWRHTYTDEDSGGTTNSSYAEGASSLTRALLACENTGLHDSYNRQLTDDEDLPSELLNLYGYNPSTLSLDRLGAASSSGWVVRGLIAGFTCDRRITKSLAHSNDAEMQRVEESPSPEGSEGIRDADPISFFIAPTISRDSSSCSWINKSPQLTTYEATEQIEGVAVTTTKGPAATYDYHCLKVDVSSVGPNGQKFSDCSSTFCMVSITVDPKKDKVKIYLDAGMMKEQTISETFGTAAKRPINIPSRALGNSFRYNASSINGPSEFFNGPKYEMFTPWIVGGGWTDGMTLNHHGEDGADRYHPGGGFMGGHAGGLTSGLRGYVGSTKFYNAALTNDQIEKNYKAQKAMFKNIDLSEGNRVLKH